MQTIREIFSNYKFLLVSEVSNSILERKVEYKNFTLLSLEDTILSAVKDAKNMMIAYTLLTTQADKIDYMLLFREMLNQNVDLDVFMPLLEKQNPLFSSYNRHKSNTLELKNINKASRSILRKKFNWNSALFFLKSKYKFIEKIGGS